MKIVFMGTPEFSVPILKQLASAFEVSLVVSQPDKKRGRGQKVLVTPVKKAALDLGLNVATPTNINDLRQQIVDIAPDFIITAAYGQFLPKTILMIPKIKALNIHASLLPKYRGGSPMHKAIYNGDLKTGISLIEMVSKMDAGDIYLQEVIDIKETDTLKEVHDKLSYCASNLIIQALKDISLQKLKPFKQVETEVTFAKNISKEECFLDFTRTSKELYDHIRAFNPVPIAKTFYNGELLKIYHSEYKVFDNQEECGKIIDIDKNYLEISVKDGSLRIYELQIPNKKRTKFIDFYNGNKNYFKVGEKIG